MIDGLQHNKNRVTTRKAYHKIWVKFNKFLLKLDHVPEKWEQKVAYYCSYLMDIECKQSSTLKTYVSAIKSVLAADGYEWDNSLLLMTSLTGTCKLQNDVFRTRLSIQKGLLELVIFQVENLFGTSRNQPYLERLYKTAYILFYYGLLRAGELAVTEANHFVKAKDVYCDVESQKILLVLHTSKTHGLNNRPQTIEIGMKTINKHESYNFSPFEIVNDYIETRGGYYHDDEPFLTLPGGGGVEPKLLTKTLRQVLKRLQLNEKLYGLHSFRIGRATDLFKYKYSVDKIKKLGRWKSNAVYKYMRNF